MKLPSTVKKLYAERIEKVIGLLENVDVSNQEKMDELRDMAHGLAGVAGWFSENKIGEESRRMQLYIEEDLKNGNSSVEAAQVFNEYKELLKTSDYYNA